MRHWFKHNGERLGLVLSQHNLGRLQPLHHCMEALLPLPGRVLRSNAREGNMRAEDVTDTIELALAASSCNQAVVRHKPRLLSDNGSCYISGDLAEWLEGQKMTHVRGAPFHPQTQGKIPSRDIATQYPDGQ